MRRLMILLIHIVSFTSCGDDFEFIPAEILNNPESGTVDSLDISPDVNGNGDLDIKVDSTVNEYEFEIHI